MMGVLNYMENGKFLVLKDKTKIWYGYRKKNNSMPTVVFCHGNAQNHTTGVQLLDYFDKLGHSTLVYDLAGHGNSESYKNNEYSMERLAETLSLVIEECKVKKPILVGHSMGGFIALEYAVRNPLKSLILISTAHKDPVKLILEANIIPSYDAGKENILNLIKLAYQKAEKKSLGKVRYFPSEMSEDEILMQGLKYTNPKALEGNFRATFDYDVKGLEKMEVPTLIIAGEDDKLIPSFVSVQMHKIIRNSKLEFIKKYGHNFLIQKPDLLIKAVEKWG